MVLAAQQQLRVAARWLRSQLGPKRLFSSNWCHLEAKGLADDDQSPWQSPTAAKARDGASARDRRRRTRAKVGLFLQPTRQWGAWVHGEARRRILIKRGGRSQWEHRWHGGALRTAMPVRQTWASTSRLPMAKKVGALGAAWHGKSNYGGLGVSTSLGSLERGCTMVGSSHGERVRCSAVAPMFPSTKGSTRWRYGSCTCVVCSGAKRLSLWSSQVGRTRRRGHGVHDGGHKGQRRGSPWCWG